MNSYCRFSFAIVLACLGACAHRREARELQGARAIVTDVDFVGAERFDEGDLLDYLNMGETSRVMWWTPDYYYQPALIPIDSERIEALYQAHGYYDAEVVDVDVEFRRKGKRARIVYTIDEGKPITIADIAFRWPSGPPARPAGENPDLRATPPRIQKASRLKKGEVLEVERINQAVADLSMTLQARGYAFADVEEQVVVNPMTRSATVEFSLVPGPYVRIGQIHIKGLQKIRRKLVMQQVEYGEGKPYSPRLVENLERTVYGMQVFSSVVAHPEPNEPEHVRDHRVDLVLDVRETDLQSIKLGGGIGIDPNRWEQRLSGRYSHSNLFGNLTHFELSSKVGYAELPAIYDPDEHGPIATFEPSLRKQGFLERGLIWTLAPAFDLGLQRGYQYYALENRVGVSRFFTRFVEATVGHTLRFVDFFSVSPALEAEDSILGRDYRDPYSVSYMTLATTFRLTNRQRPPHNGVVLRLTYDLAGGFLGGQFDFHRFSPDLRAYWQVHPRLELAARAQVGFIFPFGDEPGTPIDLKYYLGGSDSMRGWGYRTLSPYVVDCSDAECDFVPIGGRTSTLGSFEVRVRTWRKLYAVAFFDAGDVQAGVAEFHPNAWNYTTGPGLRLDTKIGKLRLDVGFRLNEDPRFQHLPIWALHFGIGEAF